MFDHRHYVPVLRWKRGEWTALKKVGARDRGLLTPLIEFTPRDFAQHAVDDRMRRNAERLLDCWGARPAFVETALLPASTRGVGDRHPLLVFAEHAAGRLRVIPVTGLDRSESDQGAARDSARQARQGAAIRLRRADLTRPDLGARLEALRKLLGLAPEVVDLIIDYGCTDRGALPIATVLAGIPHLQSWRTLTVISGAFPKDLSGFSVGEHEHPRADWLWWREQVLSVPPLRRVPAFGDYTTQHPVFSEPPGRANFSASIRYAATGHWVVMRGEGVFNDDGPGFAQWPANAQLLCDRGEFCGAEFSAGDHYIHETSLQDERTGNAETWLSAAVNHHMVFTARQVASLFGPAGST